jgi:CheY-like chemotaxis protein
MRRMTFKILLIDDDPEMNFILRRRLERYRLRVKDTVVIPKVDMIDVDLERADPGYWRIHTRTLRAMEKVSRQRHDLVVVDFGFADEEAKNILWGRNRVRRATREEARGRLLTVRDLSDQYAERIGRGVGASSGRNIFLTARRVVMRSFASRLAFDILGPVFPDRLDETKAAFPNAEIEAMDPRNEFYAGDEYYDYYDSERGRDFYRQLVGAFTVRVVEGQILRSFLPRDQPSHAVDRATVRRTRPLAEVDVFLSHSVADGRKARGIVRRLESHGVKAYLAARALQGGDAFSDKIRVALNSSKEVWVLVSPSSLNSEWVITEWGAAWGLGKRIVPILHGCRHHELPDRLRSLQCIDADKIDVLIKQLGSRMQERRHGA